MQVLTLNLRDLEFGRSCPNVHDRKIVGERHRKLVHRGLFLQACREPGEIAAHHRRAIEYGPRIFDLFLELNTRRHEPFAMSGQATAETTTFRQGSSGRARRREASRLEDTPQLLRKTLRPAARYRGIIVNEDIGTIIDWFAFEDSFHEN